MYAYQTYDKHKQARARIANEGISAKDAREVSAALRGKSLAAGLALLKDVQAKKRAIRFTRYNQESAGHRPGMGPGRYPLKAAQAFENLLESVKANAEFKDLDTDLLRIVHVKADKAARPFRYGRHRGRQAKRAHIEIVVQEDDRLKSKKPKTEKKSEAKESKTEKKEKADSKKSDEKAAAQTSAAVEVKPEAPETPAPKEVDTVKAAEAAAAKAAVEATPDVEAPTEDEKAEAPAAKEEKAAEDKKASKKEGEKQ